MRVLGIETSCDETSVAVVEGGGRSWRILANVVSSQARLHERFGGVVPEIASRAHVETLLPVLEAALGEARCLAGDCDCIAVTHRPGLIGALLVGVTAAKTLAFLHAKPIVPVDHLEAHLYALEMSAPADAPRVALLVSGGHTALYRIDTALTPRFLGGTSDDAAGEAFDKVAKILGLGYPGGPRLERLAERGDPWGIDFPKARTPQDRFSFSGLKTAVLYRAMGQGARPPSVVAGKPTDPAALPLTEREKADIAASFQRSVVEVLVSKTLEAAEREGVRSVGLAGGVAANGPLRRALSRACAERGWELVLPPLPLCTDNAAMVAGLGGALFEAGRAAALDFDAYDRS